MSILSVNNVIAIRQQFGGEAISSPYDLTQPPPLFFDNEKRAEFSRITAFPMQSSHTLYAANTKEQPTNLNNNAESNADAAIAGALLFVGFVGLGILIGGTGGLAVVALGLVLSSGCSSTPLEKVGSPVDIKRISIDSNGVEGNGDSSSPSISADGRFVAFYSDATNLVPEDKNKTLDVFIRDLQTGKTERVSINSDGVEGNYQSLSPSISADGRFVAFVSMATNLVPNDTNNKDDIFVHDRQTGKTERVSADSSGVQGNASSWATPFISADGRFVAFASSASNLVPEDTNNETDIFVRDRLGKKTERVSVNSKGVEENGESDTSPSTSSDGNFIAFRSYASNLVSEDTNNNHDIFVRDRFGKKTERVSVSSTGEQAREQGLTNGLISPISADGRFVAFSSWASNLIPGDMNNVGDVFIRDRDNLIKKTERMSVNSEGVEGNGSSSAPSISADGRFVAFYSSAINLVPGDTNDKEDIFVHDRQTGKTERVFINSEDTNNGVDYGINSLFISADGRFMTFSSKATNLVPRDTNGSRDIFVVGLEYFFGPLQ